MQKPFEAGQRAGRVRLMALLKHIMIRAAKADLVTIPPCHHKVTSAFPAHCLLVAALLPYAAALLTG